MYGMERMNIINIIMLPQLIYKLNAITKIRGLKFDFCFVLADSANVHKQR